MREILVRDLSKCINCGSCVAACRSRHGRARMTMTGPRFGQYQLPDVCRHCPDSPCVEACHLGAMRRKDGRVFVSNACRGCQKCVEACRFGVIAAVPRASGAPRGLLGNVLALAFQTSHGPPLKFGIHTDATRCVQCGICSSHCPVKIPVRDYARRGKIVDDTRCIGCGLCVALCPRGTLRFETYPRLPPPRFRADKCDLCRNFAGSACVRQCPTGAMLRLPADQGLAMLNANLFETIAFPGADENHAHSPSHHRERRGRDERGRGDSTALAALGDHHPQRRAVSHVLAPRSRVSADR